LRKTWRTGQAIKVGDEVYLGAPVARIPEYPDYEITGICYGNDISKIKPL